MKWQKLVANQNAIIYYLELSIFDDPDLTYYHVVSVPKQKNILFENELKKQNASINLKEYGEVIETGAGSLGSKDINKLIEG